MQDNIIESIGRRVSANIEAFVAWIGSEAFMGQVAVTAVALLAAYVLTLSARVLVARLRSGDGNDNLTTGNHGVVSELQRFLFLIVAVIPLSVAVSVSDVQFDQSWVPRLTQAIVVAILFFRIVFRYVDEPIIRVLLLWVLMPLTLMHAFGWLTEITSYLSSMSVSIGNIHLSLLALLRTILFGVLLFWLGRKSNVVGQKVIRDQQALDPGTRELAAKLFEIALFVVIFLVLLQVMGINLTALTVFGGALGVGLAFGLQQIASNFISGMIILFDRSITIGDFIELEDGRSGTLRELNMRYSVIETFDGKDIMVPNEQFITSMYTNWTHKDPQQRYSLEFQVAYSTDLDLLFENVRTICLQHPKVIGGEGVDLEFQPDAEIAGFGDSGIDVLVEYWMEGIDDGKNRVGADLLYSIWQSIKEGGMEIPFPQREVRIINAEPVRDIP